MPDQKTRRTPRDQVYIDSTSFEVYMIVGTIFVLGFTAVFALTVLLHVEPLIWPGSLLVIGLCYFVLTVLQKREQAAKIREVDGEAVR